MIQSASPRLASLPGNVTSTMVDDRSFVREVTTALQHHQHPDPAFWLRYNGGPLPEAVMSHDALASRFHINRHWQSIIAMETLKRRDEAKFVSDSITARYGLIDHVDCSFDQWLSILNETLFPFVLRYEIGFPSH